eukprot:scaffold17840_cov62-Isochrysis_galbana.AAC.1
MRARRAAPCPPLERNPPAAPPPRRPAARTPTSGCHRPQWYRIGPPWAAAAGRPRRGAPRWKGGQRPPAAPVQREPMGRRKAFRPP